MEACMKHNWPGDKEQILSVQTWQPSACVGVSSESCPNCHPDSQNAGSDDGGVFDDREARAFYLSMPDIRCVGCTGFNVYEMLLRLPARCRCGGKLHIRRVLLFGKQL
eukprot:1159500-Pelagomonas_calceolata.AAC.18